MTDLEGGEMDDTVDSGVLLEDLIQVSLVGQVGLVEDRSLSRDELDAVESNLGRVVEVIYDDDLIAMFEESERSEGPDVSRTTMRRSEVSF